MAEYTAEEAEKRNIEKMGHHLGTQYSALWQEVAGIHLNWGEFVELYGTKSTRLELVNRAAFSFFRMIRGSLWEGTLLHLARLTDPPYSGRKDRTNLTIQNLPELVDDAEAKKHVAELVKIAIQETAFCRDWRNRRIAHTDLKLALREPAKPLAKAEKEHVEAALKAIVNAMNAVDQHFTDSETRYDLLQPHHGAVALLYVLDDGLRAQERREERLRNRKPKEDDFRIRDL